MTEEVINISISKTELKHIIESLLYASSPTIDANWYGDDTQQISDLVCNLRKNNPSVLSENISFIENWKDEMGDSEYKSFDDKICKKIIDFFPEIVENVYL